MTEIGFAFDSMGVHKGGLPPVLPWQEAGREMGHFTVARWDNEQTDWASRRLGGEGTGQRGFIPPNDVMFRQLKINPYSVTTSDPRDHNIIVVGGWQRILSLVIGGGGQAWDSTHTRIGVGTATSATATGQTDLAATGTGRWFNMCTGVGITGAGTGGSSTCRLSFTSTFATADANFPWQEWGIDQGTVGSGTGAVVPVLLNRAVSAQSTKNQGMTWTATANLDFA